MVEKRGWGEKAVVAWGNALTVYRPIVPKGLDSEAFQDLVSFSAAPAPDGVAVMLVIKGRDPIPVKINPVVARQLAASIVQAGMEAGWLDEEGDIVVDVGYVRRD